MLIAITYPQVKNLRQKSEIQETEIQKLKKSADDATLLAADRSFKCIRATQAAKTVTDQVLNSLPLIVHLNTRFFPFYILFF